MDLKPTDVISDFYDTLLGLSADLSAKAKYSVLNRVLHQAIDQKLRGVKTTFSGLSAKVQYLLREYKTRGFAGDRSLPSAINDARHRLQRCEFLPEEQLQETYPHDLKAVCLFLSLIYDNSPIPETLRQAFPLHTSRTLRKHLKDSKGAALPSLRCFIDGWDAQFILATREDSGEHIKIDYATPGPYALGDWTYLRGLLIPGEQLNVVRPREEDGIIYPELLILCPDYLVNVTSIAACFEEYGASTRLNFINKIKPKETTRHMLLGAFAGQMLDDAAYGNTYTYAESVQQFFRQNALALACCKDLDDATFHSSAQQQRQHIDDVVRHGKIHQRNNQTLASEALVLEPSCFCETLGLQGRMDFIHLNLDTIVEQKSGSAAFPVKPESIRQQQSHYVQLLLYRAMFHYAYAQKRGEDLATYLFYSKYERGLLELGNAPRLLFEALKVRNEIAWSELHYAQRKMSVLESLDVEALFPHASGNRLWECYRKPELQALLLPVKKATALEQSYFFRFIRFVAKEHVLSKMGSHTKEDSGFAALWNSSIAEKRQGGNIYEQLVMELPPTAEVVHDVSFSIPTPVDADSSNFRKGDIVIFYAYQPKEEPNATQALVFRSTITEIKPDGVSVRLRNAQHTQVFSFYVAQGYRWAMEHDFMEASFGALYRGLYSFLTATKDRKELILNLRHPRIDTSKTLLGNYANGGSTEFNEVVLHAKQAQDIYLIIGPPGTGKTSFGMLNVLKEELLEAGSSILLMAYTNRAVDEICSKLVEEGIDFLRLGSDYNCDEAYHDYLFDHRVEQCKNVDDIRRLVIGARVMCGTTTAFNSRQEIFQLKPFQLAIVDEASQILEPNILGLLCAKHGTEEAIRKFVLIGDEKQLPAVVQQEASESVVEEADLHAIGLTNCRNSLFERLLNNYGKTDKALCYQLTRQGRMHPDIASFPNMAFYQDALRPVPLAHQRESSVQAGGGNRGIAALLRTRRVAFLSCKSEASVQDPDKVNWTEATIIAATVVEASKMMGKRFDVGKSIGVIVPYRNQISAIRKKIDEMAHGQGLEGLHDITIDTVERYQGSQRELIVYGFTVRHYYQLAFLSDNEYVDAHDGTVIDRKLNVVMTRARRNLVMVGDADLLRRNSTFHRLLNYLDSGHSLFSVALDRYVNGLFDVPA